MGDNVFCFVAFTSFCFCLPCYMLKLVELSSIALPNSLFNKDDMIGVLLGHGCLYIRFYFSYTSWRLSGAYTQDGPKSESISLFGVAYVLFFLLIFSIQKIGTFLILVTDCVTTNTTIKYIVLLYIIYIICIYIS